MPDIKITKVEHDKYGKCIELSNGNADLLITIDKGPRIIHFGLTGGVNELCEHSPLTMDTFAGKWSMMGGHRLWHSPEENPRTYIPDKDPVTWQGINNGVRVTQKDETWTQVKKEMDITLAGCCNKVQIIHRITNKNAWPIEFSVWGITVMGKGGMQIIPQIQRDTGLLANRLLSLWPYTKMNDHRVYWGDKYISLTQDENTEAPFKIGLPNEDGWAAYFNHDNLFIKRFPYVTDGVYPDFGSSYETYTTDYMMEMESLSPLKELTPEETTTHIEQWELIADVKRPASDNEEEISKTIKCYIEGCAGCR